MRIKLETKKKIIGLLLLSIVSVFYSCSTNNTIAKTKRTSDLNYIPYYLKVYEADSLFVAHNYKNSYRVLDSLFKHFEPINLSFYKEYETYVKSGILTGKYNTEQLKKLVSEFGYKYKTLENDSLLSIALKKSKLSTKQINELENNYINSLDLEFRNRLKKMDFDDQAVRTKQHESSEKKWTAIKKIDQFNDSIFIDYLNKKGFPSQKLVGIDRIYENEQGNFALNLLFNHFSFNGSYDFYKKELVKHIMNGSCDPRIYAMMIDRWHIVNTTKPYYYYSWQSNFEIIKDELKEINIRRKAIGLPSTSEENSLNNRILN